MGVRISKRSLNRAANQAARIQILGTAVIAVLREGNWFGEIGLLDGLPPSANVAAMSPMECFFLPRRAFLEALNENPEIAVGMLPGLGRMVRSADQWIAQLL